MLDAIDYIPPGRLRQEVAQIQALSRDQHPASIVVHCRKKDLREFTPPFDTLRPAVAKSGARAGLPSQPHRSSAGKKANDEADPRAWQVTADEDD